LVAGDLLAVADISASESKKITVTDFLGQAVTLIADASIPNAKIVFGSASIPGSALVSGAVGATQLANDAVTAAKLGDESTVDLVTTLPVSGAFVGQIALDTDDSKAYIWNGSSWVSFKAAGSINSVVGSSAGLINITVTTVGDAVTITTSLDNTTGAAQFLAGPTGNAGAVGYRQIVGTDLPAATTTTKGSVIVNGEGLRMDVNTIEINNDVTASITHSVVTYDSKGLITAGRSITASDLPAATTSAKGGVIVGTGLSVDGSGLVNHTNNIISGTASKITFDSQGHVTGSASLDAADIPNLAASKITTGTFGTDRIANNSITGLQIADYAISKFGETQPTADHIGQFFFNPLSRDLFLWDGNVFQPIGISIGEIVFAGTFDASLGGGTGLVASVTAEGAAVGLVAGQALPVASASNSRYYLVVSEQGTITAGNAPNVTLSPPDIVLSNGTQWTEIDVSQTVTAQVAGNVSFTPAGNIAATNVQAAIQELDLEKVGTASPVFTGDVTISTGGTLIFEGATANTFETSFTVTDPTADRTITFPDATGTVVLSGSIVNADINASAAIAFSKLASLTSGRLLVGNASNVATSVAVTGDISITNAGVTAISSGVIVDADVNASAAIAFSKLANVSATDRLLGRSTAGAGTIEEIACTAAGRALIDDLDAAAQRTTLGLQIGTDVQAYDVDTAKLDVIQTFTAAQTFTGGISDGSGSLRTLPQNSKTSAYTLLATDTGKHINITTGGVTVPSAVFSPGDIVTIFNNSGTSQSIVQGASTTLRLAGSATTGTRTLAQYGVATVLCVASNTFVVSGGGLT
jgi:hypothetical protein